MESFWRSVFYVVWAQYKRIWLLLFTLGCLAAVLQPQYFKTYIYPEVMDLYGPAIAVSHAAAWCIKVCVLLVLMPVCRITITYLRLTPLRYLFPFNDNITYHKILGLFIFVLAWIHVGGHICNFVKEYNADPETYWAAFPEDRPHTPSLSSLFTTQLFITGILMLVAMHIALPFALSFLINVKKKNCFTRAITSYDNFWFTHHICMLIFLILLIIHPSPGTPHRTYHSLPGVGYRDTWVWVGGPLLLYLCEKVYRMFFPQWQSTPLLEARILPDNVLSLKFAKPKGFKAKSGQYIYLACSNISKSEWHPFTLTSSPHQDHVSVMVRALGDWTRDLHGVHKEYLDFVMRTAEVDLAKGVEGVPVLPKRYRFRVIAMAVYVVFTLRREAKSGHLAAAKKACSATHRSSLLRAAQLLESTADPVFLKEHLQVVIPYTHGTSFPPHGAKADNASTASKRAALQYAATMKAGSGRAPTAHVTEDHAAQFAPPSAASSYRFSSRASTGRFSWASAVSRTFRRLPSDVDLAAMEGTHAPIKIVDKSKFGMMRMVSVRLGELGQDIEAGGMTRNSTFQNSFSMGGGSHYSSARQMSIELHTIPTLKRHGSGISGGYQSGNVSRAASSVYTDMNSASLNREPSARYVAHLALDARPATYLLGGLESPSSHYTTHPHLETVDESATFAANVINGPATNVPGVVGPMNLNGSARACREAVETADGTASVHVQMAPEGAAGAEAAAAIATAGAMVTPEKVPSKSLSKRFLEAAAAVFNPPPKPVKVPVCFIDGPYGAPMQDVVNFKVAVLTAAGIGITPCISQLTNVVELHRQNAARRAKEGVTSAGDVVQVAEEEVEGGGWRSWFRSNKGRTGSDGNGAGSRKMHRVPSAVYVHWSVRDWQSLTWLEDALTELAEGCPPSLTLHIHIHVTGKLPDALPMLVPGIKVVMDGQTDAEAEAEEMSDGMQRVLVHKGRVNWEKVLTGIAAEHKDVPQIGLFYCGGLQVGQLLKDASKKCIYGNTFFQLHSESYG